MNELLREKIMSNTLSMEDFNEIGVTFEEAVEHFYDERDDIELSYNFFKNVYRLKPNENKYCFELLLLAVRRRDFESALNYALILDNQDKRQYRADTNTYLRLLNELVTLPNEVTKRVEGLRFSDIRVDMMDTRFEDYNFENKIRGAIFSGDYERAKGLLSSLFTRGTMQPQDYVLRTMTYEIVRRRKVDVNLINQLLDEGKYEEVYLYFANRPKTDNENEKNYGYLSYILYSLVNGGVLPKRTGEAKTFSDGILKDDFEGIIRFTSNPLITKFLKIINAYNKDCRARNFISPINDYTDSIMSDVYEYFTVNSKEVASNVVEQYLYYINRHDYTQYMDFIIELAFDLGDLSLIYSNLESLNYPKLKIDVNYLKELYNQAIKEENLNRVAIIYNAMNALDSKIVPNVLLEVMNADYEDVEHKLFGDEGSAYLLKKDVLSNTYKVIFDAKVFNKIGIIEPSSNLEENLIIRCLEAEKNIDYLVMNGRIVVRGYIPVPNADITDTIKLVQDLIEKENYDQALNILFTIVKTTEEFSFELLTMIADVLDKVNSEEASKYREIANTALDFNEVSKDTFVNQVKRLISE